METVTKCVKLQGCRTFYFFLCVVLFIIATVIFNDSIADENKNAIATANDNKADESVRNKVKPEWRMPDHYPIDGFDGMGKIDSISTEDGEIVINDRLYLISPDTSYSTPSDVTASAYLFNEGMNVGFLLGMDNKITSIWLIEIKRR